MQHNADVVMHDLVPTCVGVLTVITGPQPTCMFKLTTKAIEEAPVMVL